MIATTSEGRKRCNGGHLDGTAYKDDRRNHRPIPLEARWVYPPTVKEAKKELADTGGKAVEAVCADSCRIDITGEEGREAVCEHGCEAWVVRWGYA